MAEESVVARSGEARVSTGNSSLDTMLEGGLVARRPYLIVGPSGTGKTTLAIQFLCDGVRRGEHVLLVTLEEPPNEARVNHRGLEPEIDRVDVFDAIPDIMRYERTPFKDIASVRSAIPFREVPLQIRRSPELTSVEVTITSLEQMLRTEVIRKNYTRLVIDSLTALQYFCMKGFDPVAGAQSLLRFLSDMRVTTLLTVEAPLEDVETPERMLARGEIRLFRWELDGQTVRAVGVEKFRGSSHDVRLHPYRIGPKGIDVNLEVTISRDTRQIIQPMVRTPEVPAVSAAVPSFVSAVTPLMDEVRDLVLLGADVAPARAEIEGALSAANAGRPDEVRAHLSRISSLVLGLVDTLSRGTGPTALQDPGSAAAIQRLLARADSVRTGVPPTSLPAQSVLQVQLGALLSLLPLPAPVVVEKPATTPVPTASPEIVPATLAERRTPPTTSEVIPAQDLSTLLSPPPSPAIDPRSPESEATAAVSQLVSPPVPPPPPPPPPPPVASAPSPAASPAPAPLENPIVGDTTAVAPGGVPVLESFARPPPPSDSKVPKPPRSLAGPPKSRTATPAARVGRPASPVTKSHVAKGEGPPPLPTTSVPDWNDALPARTHTAETLLLAASKVPTEPSGLRVETVPAAAVAPAVAPAPKKRRKSSTPAPSRKSSAVARAATAHAPSPVAPLGLGVATSPPPPATSATKEPVRPTIAEPPPKVRRRTPRKRKAPPVVAATVEPIPPGVFGNREAGSAPPPDSDDARPPEG